MEMTLPIWLQANAMIYEKESYDIQTKQKRSDFLAK